MAGVRRRTKYRKAVTRAAEEDFPEPEGENEHIVRAIASRGDNHFEVRKDLRDPFSRRDTLTAADRADAETGHASVEQSGIGIASYKISKVAMDQAWYVFDRFGIGRGL